jgi:hypothetical protein
MCTQLKQKAFVITLVFSTNKNETSPASVFFPKLIHNSIDYFKCMHLKKETHWEASQSLWCFVQTKNLQTLLLISSISFRILTHIGNHYFKCMQLKQETYREASQCQCTKKKICRLSCFYLQYYSLY